MHTPTTRPLQEPGGLAALQGQLNMGENAGPALVLLATVVRDYGALKVRAADGL